jgi:Niemann-Pick C1 protein
MMRDIDLNDDVVQTHVLPSRPLTVDNAGETTDTTSHGFSSGDSSSGIGNTRSNDSRDSSYESPSPKKKTTTKKKKKKCIVKPEKPLTRGDILSKKWSNFIINRVHKPLYRLLHFLSGMSARNPITTVSVVSGLSVFLAIVGLLTNFNLVSNERLLWTPTGSDVQLNGKWLYEESHFPKENMRKLVMFFHGDGRNVLTKEAVRLVFNATETIMNHPTYTGVCSKSNFFYTLPNGTELETCPISGVMRFWNHSSLLLEWFTPDNGTMITTMSKPKYPSGAKVVDEFAFGTPVRDENGMLTSVLSYPWGIGLPDTPEAADMELQYVDILLDISKKWQLDPATAGYHIETRAESSFATEFSRGILIDLPLIPFVVVLMTAFSCLYLYRRDKVLSRSLLGLAAVASVGVSVLSGYGLMFIVGIPFTSLTQLVPFIIFGVGLDDAFIIVDTYVRTDPRKDPVKRIYDTIDDCGVSITMTTITSTLAFASGILSSVPAIRWICWYASPTIFFVLIYQVTFMVACVVLDERRVKNNRRDMCLWITVNESEIKDQSQWTPPDETKDKTYGAIYRLADKYILTPQMKYFIFVNFVIVFALCAHSASQLSQAFDFKDVLPKDSYLTRIIKAAEDYRGKSSILADIVFRDVDFSDPSVHEQMENYINDLVATEYITNEPENFWLRDFKLFQQNMTNNSSSVLSFTEQINFFLNDTAYNDLYKSNFGFDDRGNLVESRCQIAFDNVRTGNVEAQIKMLREQRQVSLSQPVNAGLQEKDRLYFFAFAPEFNIYSFYSVCVNELIGNTILGIASVTVVAMLFIPHWTAAVFICPIVCIMYVDILGVLQWAGIYINAVTFVALIMSIGLIVDFIMHIVLRFFESPGETRHEKIISTLCTMGLSVLAGGFSTFLGTMPLAFSTTSIFWIVFVAFLTLVYVALAHGLLFLPILLDTIGPEVHYLAKHKELEESSNDAVRIDHIPAPDEDEI